ncbi:plasmid replication initiation protein [Lacticaseibacillus paracasei]|uniref:replication initiator protein A n=1 Tax=Lacticaseibacillus paracasei TaxID=1597 RepID=UPI000E59A202|nr:plasmid replication initiation protein [Lacticaseibacillus paracasei]
MMTHSKHKFTFIEKSSAYQKKYFQFPQVLLYGEKYKSLSDSAKIAYMVLQSRLDYSLKNNWIDESNHVYFIFTNQELKSLMHWSNDKLRKVKSDLINANLLYQEVVGFNPKTGKNEPNRLYLSELDVSATDVYLKAFEPNEDVKTHTQYGKPKIGRPQETVQTTENSGKPKIGRPRHMNSSEAGPLENSGKPKIGHDLYKTLDTNTRDNKETEKLDFSTNRYSPEIIKKQNQDLVKNARNYLPESTTGGLFLNKEGVELLGLWCRSPKQLHRFLGIILNAKKAVEREHEGTAILLDDPLCQEMINKTIRRFFNILRSDSKKINNVENYLFGAMKETLVAYWNKSLMTANGGDPNEF